jgi:hypothetical protein
MKAESLNAALALILFLHGQTASVKESKPRGITKFRNKFGWQYQVNGINALKIVLIALKGNWAEANACRIPPSNGHALRCDFLPFGRANDF